MIHADIHINLAVITAWMSQQIDNFQGPIIQAHKFPFGQSNPTFRLDTPNRSYVLRCKPPGILLKSAHAIDREFCVQQALAGTDVPVAHMYALCMDDTIIGSAFYVMDYIAGRRFNDPRLLDLEPTARFAVMDRLNHVLASIHLIDVVAVGLEDFGPIGHYYRRQLGRWVGQYRASETEIIPAMEALIPWLESNMPEDDGRRTLVHGDYRLDNLLFTSDGLTCRSVLDWELSTIGHPFVDLAALIMQWRMPIGEEGRGLEGVDRIATGLMEDQKFIALYCARTDIPEVPNFGFYLAFCFFRMAAIIQGVRKRALDGNASNPGQALKMSYYIPEFARKGLQAAAQA